MKRWVTCLIILYSIIPTCVLAVSFGEIKLHSYLNEPLDAEIELLGTETYDTDRLLVSLASAQEFKRAGVERPFFLTEFRFQVSRKDNHTSLRITSIDPVKQPFLDFLIDLSWPGGRLVRGYTLLLDPAPIESGRLHEKYSEAGNTSVLGPNALPLDPAMLAALEGPPPLTEINESNITSILSPETLAKNSNTVKLLSNEKQNQMLNENTKQVDKKLQGVGLLTSKVKNPNTSTAVTSSKSKPDDSATYVPLAAGKAGSTGSSAQAVADPTITSLNSAVIAANQAVAPNQSAANQSNASAQYEPLFEPDKTEKKYPLPPMTVVSNDGTSFSNIDNNNSNQTNKMNNLQDKQQSKLNTADSAQSEASNRQSSNIPPITLIAPSNPHTVLQINFNVKQMLLVVICLLMLFGGIVGTLQLLKRRRQPMTDSAEDILASIAGLNSGIGMQPSFANAPGYQRSRTASNFIMPEVPLSNIQTEAEKIYQSLFDQPAHVTQSHSPNQSYPPHQSAASHPTNSSIAQAFSPIHSAGFSSGSSTTGTLGPTNYPGTSHPSTSDASSLNSSMDYHEAAINKILEGENINPEVMMDQNWLKPGMISEEIALKLNLARQYLDMGDNENALSLLNKILSQGSVEEKEAARKLLNAFN